MTIQEQFVSCEIALKLKNLGFDEECFAFSYIDKKIRMYYEEYEKLCTVNYGTITNSIIDDKVIFVEDEDGNIEEIIAIPLWSQVIDWLREKHDINVEITRLPNVSKYGIVVTNIKYIPKDHSKVENFIYGKFITFDYIRFDTHQEAREFAILKAIELLESSTNIASTTEM